MPEHVTAFRLAVEGNVNMQILMLKCFPSGSCLQHVYYIVQILYRGISILETLWLLHITLTTFVLSLLSVAFFCLHLFCILW